MKNLEDLLDANWTWAARTRLADPGFLARIAQRQRPSFLWIGCADSRIPVSEIIGAPPGLVFVHRNIANIAGEDPGSLAVIQYAVEVLAVKCIVVCGHYGCGGVKAALGGDASGHVAEWIEPIRDIYRRNEAKVDALPEGESRQNVLCELNVREQVRRVSETKYVQEAWESGRSLVVHGLVYNMAEGTLKDLGFSRSA